VSSPLRAKSLRDSFMNIELFLVTTSEASFVSAIIIKRNNS